MNKTLTIFFALLALTAAGQTTCDTIHDSPETPPQYHSDVKGLLDYSLKNLSPIISGCMKQDGGLIAGLYIVLTIDAQGNITAVDFPEHQTSDKCEDKLRQEIMTMTGWTPGKAGGQPVCSRFKWRISCLLWE